MLTDNQKRERLELIRKICIGMDADKVSEEFQINEYCFGSDEESEFNLSEWGEGGE